MAAPTVLMKNRGQQLLFATSPYTGEAFYGRSWSEGAFEYVTDKHP